MADAAAAISPAQPARYYRGYRRYPVYRRHLGYRYPGYYGAYAHSPSYNYWYYAPASVYTGSREALDTCSLC